MRISFHHANPGAGNESFLLRFDTGGEERACVLVDAGHGVDLDALLEAGDRLAAIALTHAHADHYSSLSATHRDDAPILTSPATAAVLEDVFEVADDEYGLAISEAVEAAITPIADWTPVAPSVEIHPVPAGHVPGATGFLVRAVEEDRSHHLLATGDFTLRRAGGFPGFDPEGFVDIDTLFLTAATNDRFEASLTEALGTVLEHAHSGAPTLVTTSGLVGVQIAYLLSMLVDEHDLQIPVRVIGQVAKLYEALDYDCPGIEVIPRFQNPSTCVGPGVISIAGPDVPDGRSSGRLYSVIRDDPSACVVQLVGSGKDPLTGDRCTVHDYRVINHPTRETLVEVHDALSPKQTVITHRHGGTQGEFNDLSSVVWGTGDTNEYTLFDGHQWRYPPWMGGGAVSSSDRRSVKQFASAELLASFSAPSLTPHDEPDLEAEGIDTEQIASRLHRGPETVTSQNIPRDANSESVAETPEPETTTTTMSQNGDETTERDEVSSTVTTSPTLIRTTGLDLEDIDPAARAALDDQSLTPENVGDLLTAREHAAERESEPDEREETEKDSDETEPPAQGGSMDTAGEGETRREASNSESVSATPRDQSGTPRKDSAANDPGGTHGDGAAASAEEAESAESASSSESAFEDDGDSECCGPTEEDGSTLPPEIDETTESMILDLNPLAVTLVERATVEGRASERSDKLVNEAIVSAVGEYVVALLAGDAAGTDDERFDVHIDGSRAVERALTRVVEDDEQFESSSELDVKVIASALGGDLSGQREITGLGAYRRHLDAIRDNEAYSFEDSTEIVEAAIARWVTTG